MWVLGPLPFLAPAAQVKSFHFPSPDACISESLSAPDSTSGHPPRWPLLEAPPFFFESAHSRGGDPLKDSFRSFSKSRMCWCLKAKLLEPQSSFGQDSSLRSCPREAAEHDGWKPGSVWPPAEALGGVAPAGGLPAFLENSCLLFPASRTPILWVLHFQSGRFSGTHLPPSPRGRHMIKACQSMSHHSSNSDGSQHRHVTPEFQQ